MSIHSDGDDQRSFGAENFDLSMLGETPTGRSLVFFREDADASETSIASVLSNKAGLNSLPSSEDLDASDEEGQVAEAPELILSNLGIAVVDADEDQAGHLAAAVNEPDNDIELVIPEMTDQLFGCGCEGEGAGSSAMELAKELESSGVERLCEMLKLVSNLVCKDEATLETALSAGMASSCFTDSRTATWGLQATGVVDSKFSGRGTRVAVIDTGIDRRHPDFDPRQRRIVARSFSGVPVQDQNGHGTHCIGTACGPENSRVSSRRYGVAHNSEIFALKVFNNASRPTARRGDVIRAMDFANRNGCKILSLSLGAATNGAVVPEYARAISRLRRAGSLVIAAAGNSGRLGFQTGAPANSPDAMAIAALDACLRKANFSNTGKIELAAPGVNVLSSLPMPNGLGRLNGTSMATPHVAGIAALWLEANPGMTPDQLERKLQQSARDVRLAPSVAGSGFVQAPVGC